MSRTSAHRPYPALAHQPGNLIELHDHRNGPCDLPDRNTWLQQLKDVRQPHRLWQNSRCTWELADGSRPHCGCAACTGRYDREADRRRQRRSRHTEIRQQLQEHHDNTEQAG